MESKIAKRLHDVLCLRTTSLSRRDPFGGFLPIDSRTRWQILLKSVQTKLVSHEGFVSKADLMRLTEFG